MAHNYSIEKRYLIWDDGSGERIEVGQDSDGLELVEIRQIAESEKVYARITMTIEQAKLLSECLAKYLEENSTKEAI